MDINVIGIHPTAIISEKAVLGKDVHVGAYTIIGDNVEIGEGTKIGSHVLIEKNTKIGKNCRIYKSASIGTDPQDLKYKGEETFLEIGDNVIIREFSTMNRGTTENVYTRIGNNCTFLAYSHVAHDCEVGDFVVFSNCGTIGGHVKVGNHVTISGLSAVHQFCKLGDYSFVQAGAIVTKDVPPVAMVAGNVNGKCVSINIEKLKRLGYSQEVIREVKQIHRILYGRATKQEAIAEIMKTYPNSEWSKLIVDFIEKSDRGIVAGV